MRILKIVEGTSVDGPGLRTSLYLAGCPHHCHGCHNPQSWDMNGGQETTIDALMDVIAYNEAPVTLSGGDPLAQPEATLELVKRIKSELGYNIWCYTGYEWEQIVENPQLRVIMPFIDALVDSPFKLEERDTTLRFKGSRNQRIIDVGASLAEGKPILLEF